MCFSQEAVKSYLFCLLSAYNIALILQKKFFFSVFFVLFFCCSGCYWTEGPSSAASHRRFHCLQRESRRGPSDTAASHHLLSGPQHSWLRSMDGLMCKECASVHKRYVSLYFFFSSVLVEGALGNFFSFFFWVWGISSNQTEKEENEVTILPSVWL